jgi:hypothetical protein
MRNAQTTARPRLFPNHIGFNHRHTNPTIFSGTRADWSEALELAPSLQAD